MSPSQNSPSSHEDRAGVEARARASLGISGGESHYAWSVRGLEADLRSGGAILDLGCGVGLFGKFLQERFGQRPDGVDVIRHAGFHEECYASFEMRDLNAALPSGKVFDFIFAIGLIEYLPDPRGFFRSVPALLAPGGRFVVTAPNPASLRSLLSLAVRGEYGAFRESSNPASITPVLAVDAMRMLREARLSDVALGFSDAGRIPLCQDRHYQQLLPFLRGRLWSDDFRCIARSAASSMTASATIL